MWLKYPALNLERGRPKISPHSSLNRRRLLRTAGGARPMQQEEGRIMTTTSNDKSVDQATHGSGNRNADHRTGSDKQRQQCGVENTPVQQKQTASGRLPQRAASNERSP